MKRRRRWPWVAGLVGIAAVTAFLLWPGDRDRVQGAWVGDRVRLTFDGDLAVLEGPDYPAPIRTYFRLDPAARPKRIVLWAADTPGLRRPRVLGVAFGPPTAGGPDFESRGIYELDGDRLRVCVLPPGNDFPTGFDSTGGVVHELRRE